MAQTNSKKPGRVPIYKDINLSFIQHPKTGDISTVSDEEAIKRSVRHLVMTRFEERQFEPEIGSTIINLLFEPKTPFTMLFISDSIKRVINNFEPRVKLLDVVVDDQTDWPNSKFCAGSFA